MSNLYLLQRKGSVDYDEYDSCVVVADTLEDARYICPSDRFVWCHASKAFGFYREDGTIEVSKYSKHYNGWAFPDDLDVILIGKANDTFKEGDVICASFNAGWMKW